MALINPVRAKSIIFDIADNHGDASYMGVRQIDFWYKGKKIFLVETHNYVTYVSSEQAPTYASEQAFDCTLSLIGTTGFKDWITAAAAITNQRLICVFDEEQLIDEIRINNSHSAGANTTRGINNVKIYASIDEITDTTYGNSINRSKIIFDGTVTEHTASDVEDEENLALDSGYRYISEIACADNIEYFQRMRDFVCKRNGTYDYSATGIGWTLYDSSYAVDEDNPTAGDWYVIRTQGSLGDFDFFIYFEYQDTYIKMKCSTFWDLTGKDIGSDPGSSFYSAININTTDVPILGVYGDMDRFIVFGRKTDIATTTYLFLYGRIESTTVSDEILTATSTYAIGSDVSITFNEDLPSDWIVGNSIYLWSGEGDGFEVVELKTVNTGTKTITVDLTKNLPTATVRGTRFFSIMYATSSSSSISPLTLIANNGSENQPMVDRSLFLETNIYTGAAPDYLDDDYICSYVYLWNYPGFGGKVPFMISVPQGGGIPYVSDTITIGTDTYKILSNARGSARYAMLEN